MAESIIIAGMTGQGKSPFTRALLQLNPGRGCLVYDVNNEYGEFCGKEKVKFKSLGLTTDIRAQRCRYAKRDMNMTEFMNIAKCKSNCDIVFEEATVFFYGRIQTDLIQLVVNKGHTNNNYIFLFHSLANIPPTLLRITNKLVLFKTADSRADVQAKNERLLPYFEKAQNLPKGEPIIIPWID